MNGYELSRAYFDWSFENPDLVSPGHTAIYFFAIEHCNRLGWKEKFGFPSQMAMDAIGIKKHETFIRYFNDLCDWGFIKLVQKSTNQYTANIISLESAIPKNGKSLEKAIQKHREKQTLGIGESIGSIDKPITLNLKQDTPLAIHPLQKFVSESCPRVSKLQKQLTFGESERLVKEFDKHLIKETLTNMENYKNLKYISVNHILRKWMSSSIQTNGSENTSFSGPQKLGNTKITFTPKVNV